MTESSFDLGYCFLETANLTRYAEKETFSISNYITDISFNESIHSSVLMGEMTLLDSSGLLDNYPILGEEILTLTYSDFYNNSITQEFLVYSLSEAVVNNQQNTMFYKLKFISPQHFMSSTKNIRRSYTGSTKEIVEKIFNEFLVDDTKFRDSANEIDIEDTTGIQTIVVPSLQPIEAIDFLKRKSFSAENKSSNYYFFQNRQKFKMVTHEKLILDSRRDSTSFDQRKIYTFDPSLLSSEVKDRDRGMNNVISFFLPKRLDTLAEMNAGAMVLDVVEIDILKKQYLHNIHKYKETFKEYTHIDSNYRFPHTDNFVEDFFNDENVMKTALVFKDFERENQYYKEIIGPRVSNRYYLSSVVAEIEIYGRNDLFAGDVIKLNIPQFENVGGGRPKNLHTSLSGYWLVNNISHKIQGKKYTCKLVITKDLVISNTLTNSVLTNIPK